MVPEPEFPEFYKFYAKGGVLNIKTKNFCNSCKMDSNISQQLAYNFQQKNKEIPASLIRMR